jgi:hypothetical protein
LRTSHHPPEHAPAFGLRQVGLTFLHTAASLLLPIALQCFGNSFSLLL